MGGEGVDFVVDYIVLLDLFLESVDLKDGFAGEGFKAEVKEVCV